MSILTCAQRFGLRVALPAVLALFPALLAHADSSTMVFRFRPGSEAAPWTNPVEYRGGATPDTASTPLDIDTLNPLNQDLSKVELDGINDYVAAISPIKLRRSDATFQGLTAQIWFRADRLTGTQVLLSNVKDGGFAVRLYKDKLEGVVRIGSRYVTVTGQQALTQGRWYVATFIVCETTAIGTVGARVAKLSLHLDGKVDGLEVTTLVGAESLVDSSTPPVLGAAAGQLNLSFKGRIHAASVRNYAMDLRYANVKILHDGGELLGAASFDDGAPYGGSGQEQWTPPDLAVDWIANSEGKGVDARAFVPFTSDDYIVQGVAHSCEGSQTCSRNLLYLSQYWKSAGYDSESSEGITAGASTFPVTFANNRSIITEIDLDQNRITRCWRLSGNQMYGHLGGIAYFNGSVYAASNGSLARYKVGAAPKVPMGAGENCGQLSPSGSWTTETAGFASFSLIGREPVMLIGSSGSLYRYNLDADGALVSGVLAPIGIPFAKYWAPDAQGAELVLENGVETLVVSGTQGVFKYRVADALNGKPPNTKITHYPVYKVIPRGIEDLARVGTTYWTASEFGARYYQRRPFGHKPEPSGSFYPFIFTFKPSELQGRTPNESDFEPPLPPIPPVVFDPERPATGFIDYASNQEISGWASDPNFSGSIMVHIYIDGQGMAAITADGFRADVGAHAFNWVPPRLSPGAHRVEVYAIGVDQSGGGTGNNPLLNGSPAIYYDYDFLKPGNNGTVSCTTFCEGPQWGEVGGCVGAVREDRGQRLDCFTSPGLLANGSQLLCECERGFIKPGNNGTVSCSTFCDGEQWGRVGRCIGAVRGDNGSRVACEDTPGLLWFNSQLTCQCVNELYIQ